MWLPSWGPVPGADRVGWPKANSIRVRYRRRAGAWPLTSVDAGPTPEGTLPAPPGGPLSTEDRGSAASTIAPSAARRQRDQPATRAKLTPDYSANQRR